jgi:hypothetical protein
LHTLILNWMASIESLSWGFNLFFIIFIGTYTRVCVDVLIQNTQMGAFNLIYVAVVQYLKCPLYLNIFFNESNANFWGSFSHTMIEW